MTHPDPVLTNYLRRESRRRLSAIAADGDAGLLAIHDEFTVLALLLTIDALIGSDLLVSERRWIAGAQAAIEAALHGKAMKSRISCGTFAD